MGLGLNFNSVTFASGAAFHYMFDPRLRKNVVVASSRLVQSLFHIQSESALAERLTRCPIADKLYRLTKHGDRT